MSAVSACVPVPAHLSLFVSSFTSLLLCGSRLIKSDIRCRDLQAARHNENASHVTFVTRHCHTLSC
jgi:hypothetical protein